MILYGSTMSPFVRKVAAYAAEKGIEVDLQPTGFPNASPEFKAASPFGKMPALVDGDYLLADSSAIIHYLEAKYPEPELIPADPQLRGRTIWFDEFADTLLFACGGNPESGYLVDDRFTLADIAVAGPFANFSHCDVAIDTARYPKTKAYVAAILSRPSFAQYVEREAAYLAKAPA
jgi:glutathione S-transferase